ncbi:MAG: peptide deformylase [Crocinitomicaceae bacterium]|nr:peptide deformylase [Crocinitomicaceae bacterium]|tara:strand:+ start:8848 stop:9438 length:591 start_codon:yes stop_codon:yes gene_type:complete
MVLPIYAYGHPVLRAECEEIEENDPNLKQLIDDMYETMYSANGIGLAAPQVGKNLRLFLVDAVAYAEDYKDSKDPEDQKEYATLKDFKKAFINPIIIEETGKDWAFEEGCLSIPDIRAEVKRQDTVLIEYYNENWELVEEEYDGMAARIIQHEYDHIEGVLFTDKINPVRKRLLKRKLNNILKGNIDLKYKMKFAK